MEYLIVAALLGLIPAAIASKKGRSFGLWWFYGAMLFIVALPMAIIMKPVGAADVVAAVAPGVATEAAPAAKKRPDNHVPGWVVLVVLAAIGIFIYLKAGGRSGDGGGSAFSLVPVVSLAEYQQLHDGISYQQAVQIIGESGVEISRNHIDGVPGVMESVDTVMYQWANSGGSNMNAMFQNDKLMQKAQFGLQ